MCKCNKCNRVKSNCSSNCEYCSYNPTTMANCLPIPCLTGCVDILPFTCVQTEVDLPDLNLLRGAKLDSVITALIALIQENGGSGDSMFAFKTMSISDEQLNSDRINTIDSEIININNTNTSQDEEILNLSNRISDINSLNNLIVSQSEVVLGFNDNVISAELDIEKFLDKAIQLAQISPVISAKFKQLLGVTTDENYSVAPYSVITIPGITSIAVSWNQVAVGNKYDVYYKMVGQTTYTKLTSTFNTGITIPGLIPDTSYSIYITSTNAAGNVSAPSNTVTTKTIV